MITLDITVYLTVTWFKKTLSCTAFYGLHCVNRCQENITYGVQINTPKKIGSPLRGSWTMLRIVIILVNPPLSKKLDPPLLSAGQKHFQLIAQYIPPPHTHTHTNNIYIKHFPSFLLFFHCYFCSHNSFLRTSHLFFKFQNVVLLEMRLIGFLIELGLNLNGKSNPNRHLPWKKESRNIREAKLTKVSIKSD